MEALAVTDRQLGDITNRVIQIFADRTGKGPEQGKSFVNDDMVVCVLRGALTPLEETLLEQGREELVRRVRVELEEELRGALMDAVSGIAGRPLSDYSSQLLVEQRVLVELFSF